MRPASNVVLAATLDETQHGLAVRVTQLEDAVHGLFWSSVVCAATSLGQAMLFRKINSIPLGYKLGAIWKPLSGDYESEESGETYSRWCS